LSETARYIATFLAVHDPYQEPEGRASGLLSQMVPWHLRHGAHEKWCQEPEVVTRAKENRHIL